MVGNSCGGGRVTTTYRIDLVLLVYWYILQAFIRTELAAASFKKWASIGCSPAKVILMYILHPLTVDVLMPKLKYILAAARAARLIEHMTIMDWLGFYLCPDTKVGPYPALRCASRLHAGCRSSAVCIQ
eukprot:scaffold20768_cov138-Skeletonema_dohrnii-CCMP3373.AAC.9